jgi:sec-independent protein translocase protein TatA
MIGSIGWMEMVIIAILALLIVGPKGLPKLGKSIGRAIRDFKKEANELKSAVELEVEEEDRREEEARRKQRTINKKTKQTSKPAN